MHRLLQRLDRSLTWHLLSAPQALPPAMQAHASGEYLVRMEKLRAARAETFGVAEANMCVSDRLSDNMATHLVAVDHDDVPAGAIRLFTVDRKREELNARLLAGFARVRFPDAATEGAQLAALDGWIDAIAVERTFVYPGGFFTAHRWRRSGLAGVLGMAAVAWARLHGSRMSASFASVDGAAANLFQQLGATPLLDSRGQATPSFALPNYDVVVRLLTFDSARPGAWLESGVQAMVPRLAAMTALAPPGPGLPVAPTAATPDRMTEVSPQ